MGLPGKLLAHSGSPRAYALAMTKVVIFTMKGVKRWSSHIVIARRTEWTNAAIHRVSGDACGECGSVIESQWIAPGFQPSR